MRVRIKQKDNGKYVGQEYGDWTNFFDFHYTGWATVTKPYLTYFGAKLALERYKGKKNQQNIIYRLEKINECIC